jgi:hypothetical protein
VKITLHIWIYLKRAERRSSKLRNLSVELTAAEQADLEALSADQVDEQETEGTPQAAPPAHKIPYPYESKNGCLYRKTGEDESKYLSNFTAWPSADIIKDNGAETSRNYVIEGKLSTGRELPAVTIAADQFANMNWIPKYWGLVPRIAPIQSTAGYVRDYIQSQAEGIPQRTIYTHTGFRNVDGKLCYLYHGGAIGADNICCELDNGLKEYTFIDKQGITADQAIRETLNLMKIAPDNISFPLLAFMFLAPLTHFLTIAGITPSFALYLKGSTGTFKTTVSLLWLAHFTNGILNSPPTNFSSTPNAVERMAFSMKDSDLLVDDMHPTSTNEKRKMDELAQRLARGAGDHASRGRMNSDTTLKASYTPRGLTIITGEDMPSIGQSGLARFFFVNFEKGDINKSLLTDRQKHPEKLNASMSYFIEYLISISDILPDMLKDLFLQFRSQVNIEGAHSRSAQTVAWLQLAIVLFTEFAHDANAMTEDEVKTMRNNSWDVFIKAATEQAAALQEAQPVHLFLTVLNELLSTGRKYTERIGGSADTYANTANMLGYEDEDILYLYPETVMNAIAEFFRNRDECFPVSKVRLLNDLARADLIIHQGAGNTIVKKIAGKNSRVIALKKSALEIINCKGDPEQNNI